MKANAFADFPIINSISVMIDCSIGMKGATTTTSPDITIDPNNNFFRPHFVSRITDKIAPGISTACTIMNPMYLQNKSQQSVKMLQKKEVFKKTIFVETYSFLECVLKPDSFHSNKNST